MLAAGCNTWPDMYASVTGGRYRAWTCGHQRIRLLGDTTQGARLWACRQRCRLCGGHSAGSLGAEVRCTQDSAGRPQQASTHFFANSKRLPAMQASLLTAVHLLQSMLCMQHARAAPAVAPHRTCRQQCSPANTLMLLLAFCRPATEVWLAQVCRCMVPATEMLCLRGTC